MIVICSALTAAEVAKALADGSKIRNLAEKHPAMAARRKSAPA